MVKLSLFLSANAHKNGLTYLYNLKIVTQYTREKNVYLVFQLRGFRDHFNVLKVFRKKKYSRSENVSISHINWEVTPIVVVHINSTVIKQMFLTSLYCLPLMI